MEASDAARRWHEGIRILGVDAALDGVTAQFDWTGQDVGQPLALCDADLALHDVDAGHELRHRMLHLHTRVDLDEVELTGLIHQELDRAGVSVSRRRHRLLEYCRDLLPQSVCHCR